MKKSRFVIFTAALCMTVLCGCGSMDTQPAMPTATPAVTDDLVQDNMPGNMMPNPDDGVVNDRDGIIEPGDKGTAGETENRIQSAADSAKSAIDNAANGAGNAVRGMTNR